MVFVAFLGNLEAGRFVIELTGRLVGLILGAVFLLVGVLVSLTVVGAIIGVPLALFGLMLMVRCLF